MPDTSSPSAGTLHTIRWQEICPWLILVKALRVTLMIRVLVLATLGVLFTQWGWAMLDWSFSANMANPCGLSNEPSVVHLLALPVRLDSEDLAGEQEKPNPIARGWYWLSKPFLGFEIKRNPASGLSELFASLSWLWYLAGFQYGLWAVLVWGIFGGAIVRIAALYLTRGETISPLVALRDAVTVWPSTTGAPLITLLFAIALAVPLVLLGWLIRWNSIAVVVGLLWVIVLVWGLMLAVVLVGLLFGWPLMWACLGVERSDAFDGVSRCYAYVYQRPLHLAFFVLVAAMLALMGEMVVNVFATATIIMSEKALSLGASQARLDELLSADPTHLANQAVNGWKWAFASLVTAYPLACLWPMAVGIYLLLRRQVDATELDEITLSEVTLSAKVPQSLPPHDPTAPE